ncbi:MAG: DnaJ domain-containing protein [Bacteroidota bacterium]
MGKLTNKIPVYWRISQLLSVVALCSLGYPELCQAEEKEHKLILEIISNVSVPPSGTIWATLENTSEIVIDPTRYTIVVTERLVYRSGKKEIYRTTQQDIPLQNLLGSQVLYMREISVKIVSFASKTRRDRDSGLELLSYGLRCRVENNQSQVVSNEIVNTALSDKAIVQQRVDRGLSLFAALLGWFVAESNFKYLYRLYDSEKQFFEETRSLITNERYYYKLLDVEVGADAKTIAKAWRKKSREYHPDKHQLAPKDRQDDYNARQQKINEAQGQLIKLIDSSKTWRYDWHVWLLRFIPTKRREGPAENNENSSRLAPTPPPALPFRDSRPK